MISRNFSPADRNVLVGLAFLLASGVLFSTYQKSSRPVSPAVALSVVEVPSSFFSSPERAESKRVKTFPAGPLDLNRAGWEELEDLPGVGPELAGRILEYRQKKGSFKSIQELLKVAGIGPKKLAQIKARAQVVLAEGKGYDSKK